MHDVKQISAAWQTTVFAERCWASHGDKSDARQRNRNCFGSKTFLLERMYENATCVFPIGQLHRINKGHVKWPSYCFLNRKEMFQKTSETIFSIPAPPMTKRRWRFLSAQAPLWSPATKRFCFFFATFSLNKWGIEGLKIKNKKLGVSDRLS